MGSFYLIMAFVFSLLIAIIAVANHDPVPVNYLFGTAAVPLIVLILGSAVGGVLAMGLFSLFRGIRTAFRFREGRRRQEELDLRVKALEEENAQLKVELIKEQTLLEAERERAEVEKSLPVGDAESLPRESVEDPSADEGPEEPPEK